ncbi:MAG: MerR family transcriptional regulator [Lachnospiraceae bacterium]|jgi:DNA-binding transcriptional MerR regulator|nr:MerR family transcriptional regulator [Lachnospiraceae bacterium]
MEKYRAVPQGYMSVGELAKKMNTTVRTLQFYDKEGLLTPSAESEGGRRLYTDADIITLHQIQAMKHLGFSLDTIKNRLVSLDSPTAVAGALTGQAEAIREQIANLSESLETIEALKAEVLQMQTVNFKRYADIIVNLQMKNEFYHMIKYFDDKTLDHIRGRFDQESAQEMIDTVKRLFHEAIRLHDNGVSPECEEALSLAKEWWDMVMVFTGGDASLLPNLMSTAENKSDLDEELQRLQTKAMRYLELALGAYFAKTGIHPFEGA